MPYGVLHTPFRTFAIFMLLCPLVSFLSCLALSLFRNFDASTATHCNVSNLLPSVSAAIGDFTPQRYIWRGGVTLQSAPRAVALLLYWQLFQSNGMIVRDSLLRALTRAAIACGVIELVSLHAIAIVSSTENYAIHRTSFASFILCSFFYMTITTMLFDTIARYGQQHGSVGNWRLSLRWKRRLLIAYASTLGIAGYFFYRHNAYCEPYVYSMFALGEYILILVNMAFHLTAVLDFDGVSLACLPSKVLG